MATKESQSSKNSRLSSLYAGFGDEEEIRLGKPTVQNLGLAFAEGTLCGTIYHFTKALCNAPHHGTTITSKLVTGAYAARANGPRLGGALALLSLAFDVLRVNPFGAETQKSTPPTYWNYITSGAFAGAFLWAPRGVRSASRAALVGAAIPGAVIALEIFMDSSPFFNPMSSYSYPHYRLHALPHSLEEN